MKTITFIAAMIACCGGVQLSASWEDVRAVRAGQKVRVETAQTKQSGVFVDATSDAVKINTDRDGEFTIPRADVKRVYVQKPSNRLRNTLIGAGIGVAVGVVLYATIGQLFRNEGADSGAFLAAPVAVGTAVGAALPAKGMKRIYDAEKAGGS